MDQQLKAKWLSALLSGEYKQTTGKLCEVTNSCAIECGETDKPSLEYCCLGVLHDIAGGIWSKGDESWSIEYENDFGKYDDNDGELPQVQLNEYDLDPDNQEKLIQLNDGVRYANRVVNLQRIIGKEEAEALGRSRDPEFAKGYEPKSFKEIAAWVEENL